MRQIDFIICGSLLEVVDSWTDSAISVGNDHKCVHAIIRHPIPVHDYAKKHKSNTGWKPHLNDDNDAAAYHAFVIDSLTNTPVQSIENLESTLVSCALQSGATPKRRKYNHSSSVRELSRQRRNCNDRVQRKQLSLLLMREASRHLKSWQSAELKALMSKPCKRQDL